MDIQVFHDTVCPWCRIGVRNLQTALTQWEGEPVNLSIRAYQLDPTTPVEGTPFLETMQRKFGGNLDPSRVFGQVVQAGKAAGLDFDFDRVTYMPNTVLSHRLIATAPDDRRLDLLFAVDKAYFEDGRDIGNLETLLQIAEETGLDAAELRGRLASGEGEASVEEDLAFAREAGISGVPFFILIDKYGLSGAQPPEAFLQALDKVSQEV